MVSDEYMRVTLGIADGGAHQHPQDGVTYHSIRYTDLSGVTPCHGYGRSHDIMHPEMAAHLPLCEEVT